MKFKIEIYILLIVFLGVIIYGMMPVKQAINEDSLEKSKDFIIVNAQKSTISQWIAIGGNSGYYNEHKNVKLKGTPPSGYTYSVEAGHNTFVCYGHYVEEKDFYGEKYTVFNVESWEILYPIKRDSLFSKILPSSFLCNFDIR